MESSIDDDNVEKVGGYDCDDDDQLHWVENVLFIQTVNNPIITIIKGIIKI